MEKKLNDEFADNAIYVVENLNFQPEEFGYVEPDPKPVEEVKEVVEEVKEEENPVKGKKDAKKGKDAKKVEEVKEERKPEPEVQVVEEPVEELPPLFDSNTIHAYKKRLGCMGDIYINDAPIASLSNSNSVNEIKCTRRIMGMQMTESLRSIS